jgi:hypothetical protein
MLTYKPVLVNSSTRKGTVGTFSSIPVQSNMQAYDAVLANDTVLLKTCV